MIAMPKPFRTRGIEPLLAYTRKPGFEIRLMPLITFSLFGPYFKVTVIFFSAAVTPVTA